MKSPSIQYLVKPKLPIIIIMVLVFLGAWGFNIHFSQAEEITFSISPNFQLFEANHLIITFLVMTSIIINSLLILKLNKRYAIIRTRTFLPILFYSLFILTWKSGHQLVYPHLSLSLFLFALLLLFDTYKNRKAVIPIFWASLFIAIISIINPIFLFLMILLWLGMIMLQSFSLRTFLASLIALVIPWIFYIAYQLYTSTKIVVFDKLITILDVELITDWLNLPEKIYLLIISVLYIIALIGFYSNLLKDSIRTRQNINYLVLSLMLLLIFTFVFPFSLPVFIPFIAFFMAYLFAHLFTLNQSLFYTILFYIVILVNMAYWVFSCCFI